ncbi:MAG TPA: EamA family transporter [Holophagaceae bacterium]|nr:EamA family transporter [Holophagaceae bacterium]
MLGWIAYLTVSLVWGSTYLAIALGLDSFTPYGMVAARFTLGGLLALLAGRLRKEPGLRRADLPHLMLVGTLLLAGSNALVTWSEQHVTSGLAAILCALVPVALVLFNGTALSPRAWAGLGLGLLGIAILTNPLAGGVHLGGAGALLLAVLLWSFGTIHGKRHIQGRSDFTQVGFEMLTAGLIGNLAAPLTGGWLAHPLTLRAGLAVAYLGVFGSFIAFSAYIYLARVWAPAKMGTYAYLNPLVAVLLGGLVLHEPVTPRLGAGMLVILAGIAMVQLRPASKPGIAVPAAESA